MLSIFIFFVTALLFVDYKKNFVIIMALSVWLSCFFSSTQNLYATFSLCGTFLFFFKYKSILRNVQVSQYPLKLFSILYFSSLLLSNFFTGNMHNSAFINRTLIQIMDVFIFWCIMENNPKKYIGIFLKASFYFAILLCLYAIYEIITRSNPVVTAMADLGLYNSSWYSTEIRFGFKRAQSFLMMHTSLGGICIALFALFLTKNKLKQKTSIYEFIFIAILFFVALVTGSRSVILSIFVTLGISLTKVSSKQLFGFLALVVVFFLFQSYFDIIISSFQDTQAVTGSNSDMREGQFEIALASLVNHFWLGNGLTYTFSDDFFTKELFGAESLWIPIIIEQGVWGCITVASFFVQCFYFCIKMKKYHFCFFILAMITLYSMTSVPQFNFSFSFIYLYIMIKMETLFVDKSLTNSLKTTK